MADDTLYPIRVVVGRTGLTAHVLRAWERRYNAVTPVRTGTKRRLYRAADIRRLELLKRAVDSGYNIGHVAPLATEELTGILAQLDGAEATAAPEAIDEGGLLAACMEAVRQMDSDHLMQVLERAGLQHSQPMLIDRLLLPLVHSIGEAWQEGSLRIAHEHLALSTIRTFVGSLLQSAQTAESGPELVAGTLSGQEHEIGALIVSCLAAAQGWRPSYLGPNLPAAEIVAVAEQRGARVIALSFVCPGDDPRCHREIRTLGRLTVGRDHISVIAGGRAVTTYAAVLEDHGAAVMEDLSAFRQHLDHLQAGRG